jgi:lysine N6-hydroxylase
MKEDKKNDFIDKFAMSSDGINQDLLDSIYRLLFERLYFSDKQYNYNIQTGQDLIAIDKTEQGLNLQFKCWYKDEVVSITVDKVVLATGFRASVAHTLRHVLDIEDPDIEALHVGDNFQLQWLHQDKNNIFVQNGSRKSIGLVDPNLSVAAWRAAMIANEVLGFERYSPDPDLPIVKMA